ncbi:MAG: sulfate adenylyltransferase [Armatimonadota bacterium]
MSSVRQAQMEPRVDEEQLPIAPHGGRLISRLVHGEALAAARQRVESLPRVQLTDRQVSDLEQIAVGAFSPLKGFMGKDDYENVLHGMRLANGLPWTVPVTLAVSANTAARCKDQSEVALCAEGGAPLGLLSVSEIYSWDKSLEARLVYQTEDKAHPGVAAVHQQGELPLSGDVSVFPPVRASSRSALYLTPAETRRAFGGRGWRTVAGFQTRNPIHRAHEYLQKCALELVDGLLIHPLVGETKSDDVSAEVRLRCYEVLIEGYYPRDRVLLSVWPAAMRYAGPREAIFHALVRKNYGCTHFIVGRDHAGVGNYYGTYEAQRIFDKFEGDELGITPLFFDHAFFCRTCEGMATTKTCPHGADQRVMLSGTKVRGMLLRGQPPPTEFTRPEVAAVLIAAANQDRAERGEHKGSDTSRGWQRSSGRQAPTRDAAAGDRGLT